MKKFFQPDALFSSFDKITPKYLSERGVRLLFTDVDNTLAPYELPEPDERVTAWLDSLKEAGITVVFLSNNHSDRLAIFNASLGLDAYSDCKKPFIGILKKIAKEKEIPLSACALLGDQIFTDIWAGKRLGILSLMVPPIKDKTTLFFRAKRRLERPVLKKFAKAHPDHIDLSFWKIKE
ncbi:MAG: YqeG family HAD IIIA-type phosphatase [Clostridia bacterium]|nr:YqeG family HAD IIIA-type phosphatase [Clostridia bacterium]